MPIDSGIKALRFNNYLTSLGEGGSFQIGSIYKMNNKIRLGLVINSPIYYTVNESLSQFLVTDLDNDPNNDELILDPETEIFFLNTNSTQLVLWEFRLYFEFKGFIKF